MTGTTTIIVNPLPAQFTVGGGGTLCTAPGTSVPVTLSGSVSAINYQLQVNGANTGSPVAGTGSTITWSSQNIAGIYSVIAANAITGCSIAMSGTASIIADPVCSALANWSFQYEYDARKRMTDKKMPGADWVYMVYDDRDRLVMTQDGNQRLSKQWLFTKYDTLNRPVMTGIYTHPNIGVRRFVVGDLMQVLK